ncbi:uncharacterized protein SCHCODRAFT_02664366 [Schizophyllum commune H4-8]|nr:uncharacterized protein SCHCODRAFT_02664366 [Schizophyllum commune H4-8]KAI5896571.1 hypothetical protein SCHCODRAFT_02664366 [Schizophyllum commune H4-8]
MPLTYHPQARPNTAPQRVLFHVRHFVADRRRAVLLVQGLRRRLVNATRSSMPALPLGFLSLLESTLFGLRLSFDTLDPPVTSSSHPRDLARPSYLVGNARRLNLWLFDRSRHQDTLSTTRSTLDIETNYRRSLDLASLRHRDELLTLALSGCATLTFRLGLSPSSDAPMEKNEEQGSTRVPQATCVPQDPLGIGALLAGGAPAPDLIVVQG